MADRIFASGPTFEQGFDGGWHTFANELDLSEDGTLTGGRIWYPSTDPANYVWLVYRISDQAVMASLDADAHFGAGAVNNDWNPFTAADFDTPGEVSLPAAGGPYAVAAATNGDFVFDADFGWPVGTGIVSGTQGRTHDGGSGPVFPTGTEATAFGADVEIEAAAGDATVNAATVAAVAALPAATVQTGATVAATAIAAIAALPVAAASTGSTVTPPAIAAVTTLPAASVQAGGATVAAGVIAAVTTLPAASASGGATVAPGAIAATAALPAAIASGGAMATPGAIAAVATLPSPVVQTGGVVVYTRLGGQLVPTALRGVVRVGGVGVAFG